MDAAMLVEYFKMNRWVFTSKLQEADLILISTCAVDNSNETVSMNFLSIAKKKMRNDAKLIAFGCLPGIKEHIVNDCGMLGITRSNFSRLDSIIKAVVPIEQIDSTQRCKSNLRYADSNFSLFDTFLANFQKGSFFFLKCLLALIRGKRNGAPSSQYKNIFDIRIASGCSGLCTYCAIKKAAGPLISEDVDKIIMAFRYGLAQGFKTFRIIAEDVGAYGQDKDTSVVELLRGIFSKKEDFQLLIDDFSPKWLVTYFTELLEVFSLRSIPALSR